MLAVAADSFRGALLAMIDPLNATSKGVICKLGFEFWKLGEIDDGYCVEVYRRAFG